MHFLLFLGGFSRFLQERCSSFVTPLPLCTSISPPWTSWLPPPCTSPPPPWYPHPHYLISCCPSMLTCPIPVPPKPHPVPCSNLCPTLSQPVPSRHLLFLPSTSLYLPSSTCKFTNVSPPNPCASLVPSSASLSSRASHTKFLTQSNPNFLLPKFTSHTEWKSFW